VAGTVTSVESALLAPAIFSVLKFAEAAHLVILGNLIGKGARADSPIEGNLRPQQLAKRSLFCRHFSHSTQRTALFFLAFLPQFVDPRAGSTSTQILTFEIAFVMLGFFTNSLFACLGGKLGYVAK
jgi:threonine/homoserine/homoserine lactone efflux protein